MVSQHIVRALTLASLLGAAACGDLTQTQQRTLTGGAGGAAAGAGVGAIAGNAGLGALIGGGLGTAAGYLWSLSKPQQDQGPQAETAKAVTAAASEAMETGRVAVVRVPDTEGREHVIRFHPAVSDPFARDFLGRASTTQPTYVGSYGSSQQSCGQVLVEVMTPNGRIEHRDVRRLCRGSFGGWQFV